MTKKEYNQRVKTFATQVFEELRPTLLKKFNDDVKKQVEENIDQDLKVKNTRRSHSDLDYFVDKYTKKNRNGKLPYNDFWKKYNAFLTKLGSKKTTRTSLTYSLVKRGWVLKEEHRGKFWLGREYKEEQNTKNKKPQKELKKNTKEKNGSQKEHRIV